MKRHILSLLALIAFVLNSNAQTVVFQEDFDLTPFGVTLHEPRRFYPSTGQSGPGRTVVLERHKCDIHFRTQQLTMQPLH
jgi:hypothetical protein